MAKLIKHVALKYINNKQPIIYQALIQDFHLTDSGARSYLYYLMKQNLIIRDEEKQYWLTEEGEKRLNWYNDNGCKNEDCDICPSLSTSNPHFIKCPYCESEFKPDELRISPKKDMIFAYYESGVYCPECDRLMLNEKQAEESRIKKEE